MAGPFLSALPEAAEPVTAQPQFQDRPEACKLIETAAKRGDQAAARRLPECRAN